MERDISIYIVLLRCVILTFQYLDITHLSFKLKYNVTQQLYPCAGTAAARSSSSIEPKLVSSRCEDTPREKCDIKSPWELWRYELLVREKKVKKYLSISITTCGVALDA